MKDFRNTKKSSLIIVLILFFSACSSKFNTDFDSEKWKNWVETETTMTLRWDMRKDLTREHKLVGMTSTEIIQLLGIPEQKTKNKYLYNLGSARHGIDQGLLTLEIENKKVISFKVSRH